MKKGTVKCKNCGKYNSPIGQTYYRGKRGKVSFIKQRKEPLWFRRKICVFCNHKLKIIGN